MNFPDEPDMMDSRRDAPFILRALESVAVLVLGIAVMNFFYAESASAPGAEIGAPGHDSFYHVKMAALLPQQGLLRTFPWLQYAYFTDEGDTFVSHHYGFHVVLVPFVYLSKALTGEFLPGGRWAMSLFFGLNLVLFNLLLADARVRWRWMWLVLFLLMPSQFFLRQAFIRAIGISLLMMQLIVLLLFRRRYILAAVALAAYVHIYLGAVIYGPIIVAAFALSQALGPRQDRSLPWRMVLITALGWAVGTLTYPYFDGMIEFLRLQIAGSGLSPDIEVGREWRPYTDPWWFARMAGILLVVWSICLCARLRLGPRLNAKELTLLLIQFAFLTLTLKARRFIEYWPPFCLLSAAYMMAPVLARLSVGSRGEASRVRRRLLSRPVLASIGVALGVAGACWYAGSRPGSAMVLAEWQTWTLVLALMLLGPLCGIWLTGATQGNGPGRRMRTMAVPVCGGLFVLAICLLIELRYGVDRLAVSRLYVGWPGWIGLGAAYLLIPPLVPAFGRLAQPLRIGRSIGRSAGVLAAGIASLAVPVALGGRQLVAIGHETACYYDLGAIRKTMDFLKSHSDEGDIVFTDDWDVFPVYFYHNSYNRYIVGLDPKFTHERRPDLWERYVKISRGQTPAVVRVTMHSEGRPHREIITASLEDIRDEFHARFVITDRDHKALAQKLAHSGTFAELIYPSQSYDDCENAPYLVFRVSAANENQMAHAPAQPDSHGRLFLAALSPASVDQGWGDLKADRSVDDRVLTVEGSRYSRGLGTHAPSDLLYEVPAGYDVFETLIGIDDETNGSGSVVASIYVDGVQVYETPVLVGGAAPVAIRIPLGNARRIRLQTDPTPDGTSSDHVDWIDARFVRGVHEAGSSAARPSSVTTVSAPSTSPVD